MTMHNENNTDIEIIKKNYQNLPEEKKSNENCVLLITGSFNPIHCFHIKNLLTVRESLEMNVLAAYISPTHDGYVGSKLGTSELIHSRDRGDLCHAAILEQGQEGWIAVSRGEMEYKNGFVDFNDVAVRLAKFLNSTLCGPEKFFKDPLRVVYVCGLDHFNKCPYAQQLVDKENLACAVIYRPGASERHINDLMKSPPLPNFYYITPEIEGESPLVDVSSTAIRQYYRSGKNIDVHQSSFACVAQYYQSKSSSKE